MTGAGPWTAGRPTAVAVVIPAKNEAERIEATIDAARTLTGVDLVVVVDDGSTDATAAIAMGADALVVRHRTNRGKAAAMATGAQMVALREQAERADGGEDFDEQVHAEPREHGHTGPLPVIADEDAEETPRALLFLDADMAASASAAQPLVDAVLGEGVDMAIALLPPQDGAGGMGLVVRTSRRGIQRATGWEATQPLSGTRCITQETWDACQPLAGGWGVETGLSIDALVAGFWVKEIPCELHHRATGSDLRGQLHRAAQLRDVVRALGRRRHVTPQLSDEEVGAAAAPTVPEPADPTPAAEPEEQPLPPASSSPASPAEAADGPSPLDARRPSLRERLAALPVAGEFSEDEVTRLEDTDLEALDASLRALPVAGDFAPDDVVFLAGLSAAERTLLRTRLIKAPVEGEFAPDHAVIIASHLVAPQPRIADTVRLPLDPDEYTSLVIHAAVDRGNADPA